MEIKSVRKILVLFVIISVIVALRALTVRAQTEPPPVLTQVLVSFSQIVGHPVTPADLQSWTVTAKGWQDTSLGCGRKPYTAYLMMVVNGFDVLFTYNNVTFDYHTGFGGRIILLCRVSF